MPFVSAAFEIRKRHEFTYTFHSSETVIRLLPTNAELITAGRTGITCVGEFVKSLDLGAWKDIYLRRSLHIAG